MPEQKRGITLIELVIVVVIIGVLAGLAIPRFIRTAEKAKGDEAVVNLRIIFYGEKMYRLDNNMYSSRLVTGAGPNEGGLSPEYIEDMTTAARQKYFTITLTRPSLQTFRVRATRRSGIYRNRWLQINQNERWSGDWPWRP